MTSSASTSGSDAASDHLVIPQVSQIVVSRVAIINPAVEDFAGALHNNATKAGISMSTDPATITEMLFQCRDYVKQLEAIGSEFPPVMRVSHPFLTKAFICSSRKISSLYLDM